MVKRKESTKKRHQLNSRNPVLEYRKKVQERRVKELILKSLAVFLPSISLEIALYMGYYLVMLVLPFLHEPHFLPYCVHRYVA